MSILDENVAQNMDANVGLGVTGEMKRNWITSSKWAMFFAILGFVYIGLSLLTLGSMGTMIQMMAALSGDNPVFAALEPLMSYMSVITVVVMAAMFFVFFYHFRFASLIQRAVNLSDQDAFVKAWENLRNHFRVYGILVCVMIVIYAIAIIAIGTMVASSTTFPVD